MKTTALVKWLIGLFLAPFCLGAKMIPVEIRLDDKVLAFALPQEIAAEINFATCETKFDSRSEIFNQTGSYGLMSALHDFGGSRFTGPSGSVSFRVSMQKRSVELRDANRIDLREYINWWVNIKNDDRFYIIDTEINHIKCVKRFRNISWEEGIKRRMQSDNIEIYSNRD